MKVFHLIGGIVLFLQGRCYAGECKTRDSQCKYVSNYRLL